jgi:gamma-glutamyltranspeptidase/glutathione hydrolase
VLYLVSGIGPDIRRVRIHRDHHIEDTTGIALGGNWAICRGPATGVYFGASESRKDGCAMGY